MKIIKFGIILVTTIACSNPNDEKPLENVVEKLPSKVTASSSHKLLNQIVGNDQGIIRGFVFGDPIEKIREKESLTLFEEKKSHLGYTFDTRSMETIDILYMRDSADKLNGIQLDIYMNSDSSNSKLLDAYTTYLTKKYGEPLENEDGSYWKLKDQGRVTIQTIITKVDQGLQINYLKK